MTCQMRNTVVILGITLILFSVCFYAISLRMHRAVAADEATLARKRTELEELREHNQYFENVEQRLAGIKRGWRTMSKRMYARENSAVSFAYFSRLAIQPDSFIEYNYTLNETRRESTMHVSRYTLVGVADFRRLYNFIWKLENNTPLYTIEELEIKPVDPGGENSYQKLNRVNFVMLVTSYATDQHGLDEQQMPAPASPVLVSHNPFFPQVREQLPPNRENLLDVNRAHLLGITARTAFIRDNHNQTWFLQVGDAVYLGKLTRIIPGENAVEFTLNEGGLVRTARLELFDARTSKNHPGEYHEE